MFYRISWSITPNIVANVHIHIKEKSDRQTDRQTEVDTYRERKRVFLHRERERQRQRQTGRQTDRDRDHGIFDFAEPQLETHFYIFRILYIIKTSKAPILSSLINMLCGNKWDITNAV